jgi:excisionase family DNA binding protein
MNSQIDSTPLAHPVAAAAQRIGIGRSLIFELLARGELSAIKIGSRTLIPESELRRFIEARMRSNASAAK